MTKLTVRGLQVELDHKAIVHNIDLEVSVGQWICIIGPNGAGKSSLLKALAGINPSTGEILIDDSNLRDLSERDRACWIAYVAQEPVMPAGMRVFDYVLLGRTAHLKMLATESPKDLEIASYVIAELDLDSFVDRDVATLSGGERQRVALARALVMEPRVLLLDEPLSAVDSASRAALRDLLPEVLGSFAGATILVTHDLGDVEAMATANLSLN